MSKKKKNRSLSQAANPPLQAQPIHRSGPTGVVQVESFSGPLPHPEILARYDVIVPGAANRIIEKFEKQTDHRIEIENRVIQSGTLKEIVGLVLGFIIAMTVIVGGIVTAILGTPILGGTLSFAGLATLVGAFIYSRRPKSNDDRK